MIYVLKYFKQRKYIGKQDGNDLSRMYSAIFCGNINYKRCEKLNDGYNTFKTAISEVKLYRIKCNKMLDSK